MPTNHKINVRVHTNAQLGIGANFHAALTASDFYNCFAGSALNLPASLPHKRGAHSPRDPCRFQCPPPLCSSPLGRAMIEGSVVSIYGLVHDYPWQRHSGQVVVDVGGGLGGFLSQLLATQPNCTGVLFDRCVSETSP
jgi:hypothetical protein